MIPDISHHHTVKNWKRLCKNSSFLISKATEGVSYIDPTLKTFVNQCEVNKKPYWLYSFVRKGNELKQAEFLVKTCKKLVGRYFVGYILDVEDNSDADDIIPALKYLDSLGYKTMFYCMWAQKRKYQSVIDSMSENCAFWEARYGKNNGKYNPSYPCHDGVDLHQYTSAGKVDSLVGNIDLNRVTGAGKSLKWFMTPLKEGKKDIVTIAKSMKGKVIYDEKHKNDLTLKDGKLTVDCAGFVAYVLRKCGFEVGTSISSILNNKHGKKVSIESLRAGDIVFYKNPNHVNIYVGDGKIVECTSSIKGYHETNFKGYYEEHVHTARRFGKTEKSVKYFKAIHSYTGNSFVDALKKRGYDSSFESRKKIAKVNGILNYTGTTKQNLYLLELMRQGKLIKP